MSITSVNSNSSYVNGGGRTRAAYNSSHCGGAGRSDVLENYYSESYRNKVSKKSSSQTSALDKLLSLIASAGVALSILFGVKQAVNNTEINYEDYEMPHTCLDEDDTEILNALNEQETALSSENTTVVSNDTQYQDAQSLTDAIYESDDDAAIHMARLSSALNMDENEVSAYLINLTQSEQYGNGCIDPLTFYAQICQESGCDSNALGDKSSSTGEYLAVGLGQFHKCAVDEVNNQIKYGTYGDYTYNNGQDYTYEDRTNPTKALEMMVLLLRYDASKTEDENGMLAMYNQGNANGINTQDGQNYVSMIMAQIGKVADLS